MMQAFSDRRRRLTIAAYLVLAAAMLPGLFLLEMDNSPEAFFLEDAKALDQFRALETWFGRARGLRIVLEGEALWTAPTLAWLGQLEANAGRIRGVVGAASLARHHRWHLAQWPPADPAEFRAQVLRDPMDRQAGWVSADGSTLTLLVALYKLSPQQQERVLGQLEALLQSAPPGVRATLAGIPVINRALDREMLSTAVRYMPLLGLLAVLLLAAGFRQAREVARPLVLVGICQVVVFGGMGYLGVRFNLVLLVLPPVLFVITLATAVHVLSYQRRLRQQGLAPRQATAEAYRVKGWPVIWTGLTTCVGFGSLVISQVPPVRSFGAWSAFGIALATFAAVTLYPALLAGARSPESSPGPARFEAWACRWGRRLAAWAIRYRHAVVAVWTLAGLAWLTGLTRLEVAGNALDYLPAEHPVRTELLALQSQGIGAVTADLVLIGAQDGPRFDAPSQLEKLAQLSARLRAEDRLLGVIGVSDLADAIARYEPQERRQALEHIRANPDVAPMLRFFLTANAQKARVMLQIPMLGFAELTPLFDRITNLAQQTFPAAEVRITGQYPLVLAAQRVLLDTMLGSLGLTLVCVTLLFHVLLGSARMTWRALLPNLWPVGFVLAAMGWLGVGIDSATVMIGAVVLGLAVDDTLHYVSSFRRMAPRLTEDRAAEAALEETAGAHVLTSLILSAGFGVCALSDLVPVAQFGGLAAIGILAALAADLILVPALFSSAPLSALSRLGKEGGPPSSQ